MEATTPCVQAPTWTSEDNSPPEHLPTSLKYKFIVTQTYYSDIMFNNILPVSSLFCKISLLYLPHCHPACIPCTFFCFIFCTLCTIPLQWTICLLYLLAVALHLLLCTCITPNNNNPNLFFVPHSYTSCASCASSVSHDSASSACWVLCLFIMEILQLLCLFMPSVHHHWVSY